MCKTEIVASKASIRYQNLANHKKGHKHLFRQKCRLFQKKVRSPLQNCHFYIHSNFLSQIFIEAWQEAENVIIFKARYIFLEIKVNFSLRGDKFTKISSKFNSSNSLHEKKFSGSDRQHIVKMMSIKSSYIYQSCLMLW